MTMFYLCSALFAVIFVLFVVFPWLKKSTDQSVNLNTLTNKSLIKQRLDELQDEQQQALLSDADRQQSENELKIALLDEVKSPNRLTTQDPKASIAIFIGAILSVLVGGAVYFQANQIQAIEQWQQAQQQTSSLGQRMLKGDESLNLQDLQHFALGLRTKLRDTPQDATGWMLLGRVSGAINRVDSAIQAFEKSLQYDPNNIGTLSSYAQALLMTGQEQQVLQAKRVLLHILSLEPDNTNAMGVLAIVATELGDKQLALENWQRLLAFIPQTDPNYGAVNQRILQLQLELGQVAAQSPQVPSATSVTVTVNIKQDLQTQLPKGAFLFVFAQETTGKVRMPAAVVKMPLATFPIVVELSNNNAMMPNYTLSQLQQAKLVARVSVDGDVAQSPGEFQGETVVNLKPNETTQTTIMIDREVQ